MFIKKPIKEPRCFSCICAGCKLEYTCKEKPCDENVNVYDCREAVFECEIYDDIATEYMI